MRRKKHELTNTFLRTHGKYTKIYMEKFNQSQAHNYNLIQSGSVRRDLHSIVAVSDVMGRSRALQKNKKEDDKQASDNGNLCYFTRHREWEPSNIYNLTANTLLHAHTHKRTNRKCFH